jgi:alpha-methylacyl-CoA racemase
LVLITISLKSDQHMTLQVSGTRYVSVFPLLHAMLPHSPLSHNERGKNLLDGGAPFYNVYVCKGGGFMSVGCLEPQFFEEFIQLFMDALPKEFSIQNGWKPTTNTHEDQDDWPNLKVFLEKGFMTNTRDYWSGVFHGTTPMLAEVVCYIIIIHCSTTGSDACVLPVLTSMEAHELASADMSISAAHPQILGSHPPPVFDDPNSPFLQPGKHTREILEELGLSEGELRQLAMDGAIGEEARFYIRASKL